MESNKSIRLKYILMGFLPLLIAIILQYAAILTDILIIVLSNAASMKQLGSTTIESVIEQDYNQPMNRAYLLAAQYLLFGVCFGIWYYLGFARKKFSNKNTSDTKAVSLVSHFKKEIFCLSLPFLLAAGYAIQVLVDGMLTLFRNFMPDAFTGYDQLVSNVFGAGSSVLMLVSVILFAPIAEELLFRGLILSYFRKAFGVTDEAGANQSKAPLAFAILFQGLLFGVYHGNLIQGIYAFFLGSLFGWLAYRFSSVLPCMVLHIAVNASLLLVPDVFYSTIPTCVITILISLVILIATVYFAVHFWKKNKKS